MIETIERLAKDFLEATKNKPVRIISHHDTDGITSATILVKALKRLDKKFTVRIVKGLEESVIIEELKRQPNEILIFTDLASGSLEYFSKATEPVFILDHHEIDSTKLNDKIKIANPHLHKLEEHNCTGAGVAYFFAKAIDKKNKDLAKLAILGLIGDRQETNLTKLSQQIINETDELTIKKGLLIYPSTRPLRRTLEYSTSPYIPNVTGNGLGVQDLLRETKIDMQKTLLELSEEEMSRLLTAIMVRRAQNNNNEEIIGNLYIVKFFTTQEDARELSTLINACSRLGHSDIAVGLCLEHEKARAKAQDIYTEYKQELISGLRHAEKMERIVGRGYQILNGKHEIKDTIIGTICSMLSSGNSEEQGTILIGMAYTPEGDIKVSARIFGEGDRNLKETLEQTIDKFRELCPNTKAEVGGHEKAAGCLVEMNKEQEFIDCLKETLEVEVVKISPHNT